MILHQLGQLLCLVQIHWGSLWRGYVSARCSWSQVRAFHHNHDTPLISPIVQHWCRYLADQKPLQEYRERDSHDSVRTYFKWHTAYLPSPLCTLFGKNGCYTSEWGTFLAIIHIRSGWQNLCFLYVLYAIFCLMCILVNLWWHLLISEKLAAWAYLNVIGW